MQPSIFSTKKKNDIWYVFSIREKPPISKVCLNDQINPLGFVNGYTYPLFDYLLGYVWELGLSVGLY